VKLARLKRPKVTCSSSYVDCRPKTNAAILWDMHHTKGRLCKERIGQENETKNLNEVDVFVHCTGVNTEILNCLGPPWEAD
jgi:hypothetical protein